VMLGMPKYLLRLCGGGVEMSCSKTPCILISFNGGT